MNFKPVQTIGNDTFYLEKTKNNFAEILNKYNYKFNNNDIVAGTIIGIETDGVLVDIGATFAATTDVETALEAGGDRVLTVSSGLATVGAGFLVLYSDGTDAYVAVADVAVETADDTDFEANDLAVTNILKIAGVTSIAAGDFADAEFDMIT